MNPPPIRVLLVEDSPVALAVLKRVLATSPEIEVVGTARTGKEALESIPKIQPDVICTDFHMPQMDGLEFTRAVMARDPRPILVISASVQTDDQHNVFELLQAGAVDVFPKPLEGFRLNYPEIGQELIRKIKVLSGVSVFTQHRWKQEPHTVGLHPKQGLSVLAQRSEMEKSMEKSGVAIPQRGGQANAPSPKATSQEPAPQKPGSQQPAYQKAAAIAAVRAKVPKIVAIGASTGGPKALHAILKQLPLPFPAPIVCIQHISQGFLQGLLDWLSFELSVPVQVAVSGDLPQPGVVYFPPEQHHLELDDQGHFRCSNATPVEGHRPSITVTFQSIARVYRQAAVGVLLTGMGRDGAEGLNAIAQAQGTTIAQDEQSSIIFGMPKAAIALGAAQHILSLTEIAPLLIRLLGQTL